MDEKNDDTEEVFKFLVDQEVSLKDKQIEILQTQLEDERDKRKEDRFIFIFIIIILLDVVFFSVQENFAGPIALVLLELLILIPLARKLGVEEAAQIMDRIIGRIAASLTKSGE